MFIVILPGAALMLAPGYYVLPFQGNRCSLCSLRALMLRVVVFCQITPTDIFQDCRDVLAFIAGFGVAAKDKVCAGAGQTPRVWLAEQVIVLLRA